MIPEITVFGCIMVGIWKGIGRRGARRIERSDLTPDSESDRTTVDTTSVTTRPARRGGSSQRVGYTRALPLPVLYDGSGVLTKPRVWYGYARCTFMTWVHTLSDFAATRSRVKPLFLV